jgi:hypothetical protein
VDGHAASARNLAEEQARRLAAMTVEESTAEYDALCATWEANPHREGMELLEQQRIEELLDLRRKLDLVAGVKPE